MTAPTLAAAFLALSPSAAHAAEPACAPAPASAVANALGIPELRSSGLDGAGLTIGVISTSYNHYDTASLGLPKTTAPDDVASGALPGTGNPCGFTQPVTVLTEGPANDDEGRAMLQIVHAIAPAARLVFATGADPSTDPVVDDQAMGDAIDRMVDAGVDVIVDDIMQTADLAFASGFAATAAHRATEAGVIYTVAAGNLNVVGLPFEWNGAPAPSAGHSIGSWQTDAFRPTTCPQAVTDYDPTKTLECLDFDPSAAVDSGATYVVAPDSQLKPDARTALGVLQWGDAPYKLENQFSAYLLDADENLITADVMTADPASPYPIAGATLFGDVQPDTLTIRTLVIAREVTAAPANVPVRFSFFDNNSPNVVVGAEYYESNGTDLVGSSLVGRAANLSSVTVAAAALLTDPHELQSYSGMGPQPRYFGGVTEASVAPAPLATPEVREGPTITGLDDTPTTFFGELVDGTYYYPGTSAATPVVGAALALARQSAPNATNEQLISAMTATATPLTATWTGTTFAQTTGAGLINPTALVAAVREAPTPTPTPTPNPDAAPARLPETGTSAEGGIWALALIVLGLAGVAGARARSRRQRSV
jgi:hypothetical protein